MAVGDVPPQLFEAGIFGIVGLGSRLAESTYRNPSSPFSGNPNKTFPTIYDQLQSHGYTSKRAFSLWLNDISATTGSIIFGGIDTSKYHSPLISLPVQLMRNTFADWAVALTSVSQTSPSNSDGTKLLTPQNFSIYAILDSGSPNNYLPTAIAEGIASSMNATMHDGTPYVPCAFRQAHDSYVTFGFGGPGGPNISVPYPALIYPYGAPANIGNVTDKDGRPLCYLGLIGTNGTIFLLGDTFIRSAYLVYDVDDRQVAMAPVRYGVPVKEENIISIPTGTGLPGVTSTNTYSLPTASIQVQG